MSFNLQDYETVEERLKRFWADENHADARIVTVNHTTPADRERGVWVVEARIYLDWMNHIDDVPKATGWAFEIDGAGLANKTSALENCETSAIGRALANMNFSGNKRASREEMAKVQRAQRDWVGEISRLETKDELRKLFVEAQKANVSKAILGQITAKAEGLDK